METKSDIAAIDLLARTFAASRNWSYKTTSLRAAGAGSYLTKLSAGDVGITLSRRDKIIRWFSDHWPVDLEWPPHIPRPAQAKDAA